MPPRTNPEQRALDELRRAAEAVASLANEVTGTRANRARQELGEIVLDLGRVISELDPIRLPSTVFDPSDPSLVGKFIGIGLMAQDKLPLGELEPFYGSGVYALYYQGPFQLYSPLANSEHPIYVGKADPASKDARTPQEQEQRLFRRLKDHTRAIAKAEADPAATLLLSDFRCRFLVVQSGWQTPAEDYLIHLFRPIWNSEVDILYGIGKHGDAPTTRANLRSPWDTIHPGRDWAHRDPTIADARSPEKIQSDLENHFRQVPVYQNLEEILRKFFEDLRQA